MQLQKMSKLPRVNLGGKNTPLEPMQRLSRVLGGPMLYVKREDCTHLAGGGNKTRKLEFLMGDALEQHADTVITSGAIQSNHARQTAAAAAKLGLKCVLVLSDKVRYPGEAYQNSGNVMIDDIVGASIRRVGATADTDAEMEAVADEIRRAGGRPYVIPGGGSNLTGSLAYVECANEIVCQSFALNFVPTQVIVASGSAGTHAGLVAGFESLSIPPLVTGVSVGQPRGAQEGKVQKLFDQLAGWLGAGDAERSAKVVVNDEFVGPGYGLPSDAVKEAILLTARTEGLLLDPVYTGKAMACLIAMIRAGRFTSMDHVVFVHTGGATALFGYQPLFA